MRDFFRLITTVIIWGAFVPVVGVILSSPAGGAIERMNGGEIIALVAILTAGAVAMTYAVWHSGFQRGQFGDYQRAQSSEPANRSKTKRSPQDRVERLVDALDDDEIYELESLLLAREQEMQRQQRQ